MRSFFILLASLTALCSATLNIPRTKGPYGVNVGVLGLTDTSRLDPFAPKPENRSVVVSVFYPLASVDQCQWKFVPAYPKRTAVVFDAEVAFAGVPKGTLETVRMEVCQIRDAALSAKSEVDALEMPVVLFSGGLGLSRLWYSALAQSVASFGFTVVTVDHPYDADVVEFPDGRIIHAINSTWDDAQSEQDVNVRAKDASFVLDELAKPGIVRRLFPGAAKTANFKGLATGQVGIFGHSIGGATAATATLEDNRIKGGVNLDGGLYGPVISKGLKDPFMLFGHKDNSTSQTWIDIWPHLDWKLDTEILNATHTTFTDIPLLAELIFGDPLPSFVQGVVGGVPGTRARDVVSTYVAAFMKMILKCEPQALLQRQDSAYPEIEFDASPSV